MRPREFFQSLTRAIGFYPGKTRCRYVPVCEKSFRAFSAGKNRTAEEILKVFLQPEIKKIGFAKKLFGLTFAARAEQRWNFGANNRVIFRIGVFLEPIHIFGRNRHIRINRFHRTFGYTGVAIDTSIGVDKQSVGQLVKRFDRTNRRAIGVFTLDARFGYDISHFLKILLKKI
jgi:hypothetical protein